MSIRWNVDQYWRYLRFSMTLFPRRMSWILKHKIKLPVQIWKVQSYHEVPWTKITRVRNTIARGFGYTRAPWKASKPQSRKAAMERSSRKAAKPPWNAQAAKPQSRRAASSATHAPPPAFIAAALPPPWIAEAAKPQSRKLWDAGAVSCVHRRCVARASRSVKEPQSAKASKHHEASKRQSFKKRQSVKKRQSFKKRHSAEASKSRQRKAGCA